MNIDLSDFHEEDVLSIHIEGELKKDALDINGRKIKFIKPIKYEGDIYRAQGDKILQLCRGHSSRWVDHSNSA